MDRLISRPTFDGAVVKGGKYVLIDDVSTLGGTFAEMANHIQANGGEVIGVITLTNASRSANFTATTKVITELERRYGNAIRELFGINPTALTAAEAGYLISFRDADSLRNRAIKAREERTSRLAAKGIRLSEEVTPKIPPKEPPKKTITPKFSVSEGAIKKEIDRYNEDIDDKQYSIPADIEIVKTYTRETELRQQYGLPHGGFRKGSHSVFINDDTGKPVAYLPSRDALKADGITFQERVISKEDAAKMNQEFKEKYGTTKGTELAPKEPALIEVTAIVRGNRVKIKVSREEALNEIEDNKRIIDELQRAKERSPHTWG